MKQKHICVVSSSRSDYGLLKPLLNRLKSTHLDCFLLATGSHFSSEFGYSFNEILTDEVIPTVKMDLTVEGTELKDIAGVIARSVTSSAEIYSKTRPDLVVVLGDRYEMFGCALGAYISHIPIAHIHGGEKTEGSIDEGFRHSISKLSSLHFASTEEHRRRIIQLGEQPDRVFYVGALGLEDIQTIASADREDISSISGLSLSKMNFLITYHPVPSSNFSYLSQIGNLLEALSLFPTVNLIFTSANQDEGGAIINQAIRNYVSKKENAFFFQSLGHELYLKLLAKVDMVIGNSSSGIIEAPSLNTPTLNIGERQKGRTRAESILDCENSVNEIAKSIEFILDRFKRTEKNVFWNPYEKLEPSREILDVLTEIDLAKLHKKEFFDLNYNLDS